MIENKQGGNGGLSRRKLMIAGGQTLAVIMLGHLSAGCSGGGSSGSSGGSVPPPTTQTVTVGATTRAQGAVQTDPAWTGLYGSLYTEVGPTSQKLNGDLNYEPFVANEADKTDVNVGSTVTWREINSGLTYSFQAA